jgi:hypothetical protein
MSSLNLEYMLPYTQDIAVPQTQCQQKNLFTADSSTRQQKCRLLSEAAGEREDVLKR